MMKVTTNADPALLNPNQIQRLSSVLVDYRPSIPTTGVTSMNKTEMVDQIAEGAGVSKKDAKAMLDTFTTLVGDTLNNGDPIQLPGFGTFKISERAARKGRNPQTGETIEIAASRVPSFKAGKSLKDQVNS
jgi:DNA-binding protein HU-beta